MKGKYVLKGAVIGLILIITILVMLVLNHTVKNGREIQSIIPELTDTPVYVECEKGKPLEVVMKAKENISVSGFQLLLVNISDESTGTIRVTVRDDAKNTLLEQIVPIDTVTAGAWFAVSGELSFEAGKAYTFTLTADDSEPYFMKLDRQAVNQILPFEETVIKGGQEIESGISLGIDVVTVTDVTFGEIFYYSVPLCVLIAVFLILLVIIGKDELFSYIGKVPVSRIAYKWGNELFLLILFITICISIYIRAYVKGVYISSDSAGYLREAVNLVNGYGFNYDGMAGMHSWFANWPILYPAMIAFVMLITRTNAYLASKILSMIIVGLILLVLYFHYKKDAWVYSLCLTNIGFLTLTYYTWSEIPFMLFILLFSLILAKILREDEVSVKWYFLLGISGFGCFLTRYYGIYIWIVTGMYLLLMINNFRKNYDKKTAGKIIRLAATAFVTGGLSVGYLLLNKLMNGMASGVSRALWWDDYEKLTNDLIESLLIEIFNIFSLQIPDLIEQYPFSRKVLFLVVVLVGLIWFVKCTCKSLTTESVLLVMAVSYYVIFIGIRYVSSMDSFYFRFFEPATFLASIGLIGLLLPYLKGKKAFRYFAGAVAAVVVISAVSALENSDRSSADSYYRSLTQSWDKTYEEIPEKSVVIFSDIDFRSSYYRPDVIEGMIYPEDTYEELKSTYYGSDYLCIRAEFAKTMLSEGEYDQSVVNMLQSGLESTNQESEYVVIGLNRK